MGFPTRMILSLSLPVRFSRSAVSGKLINIRSTRCLTCMIALPGNALDSCTAVGIPSAAPSATTGQQANPPVPMIRSGENARMSARACLRARLMMNGRARLAGCTTGLLMPRIWICRNSYPARGIRSFALSRGISDAANRNCVSGSRARSASATASAGLTCPAVPPPVSRILMFRHILS